MASSVTPILSPGYVSIYGTASIYGFGYSRGLAFGVINQMGNPYQSGYSVGQNVLFPISKNYLTYGGQTYFLMPESDIILIEQQTEVEPEP
jgi:hypothetical protein